MMVCLVDGKSCAPFPCVRDMASFPNPYDPPHILNVKRGDGVALERMSCPQCGESEKVLWRYVVLGKAKCSTCGARLRLRLPGILRYFELFFCGVLFVSAVLGDLYAESILLELVFTLWLLGLGADVALNVLLGYLVHDKFAQPTSVWPRY